MIKDLTSTLDEEDLLQYNESKIGLFETDNLQDLFNSRKKYLETYPTGLNVNYQDTVYVLAKLNSGIQEEDLEISSINIFNKNEIFTIGYYLEDEGLSLKSVIYNFIAVISQQTLLNSILKGTYEIGINNAMLNIDSKKVQLNDYVIEDMFLSRSPDRRNS